MRIHFVWHFVGQIVVVVNLTVKCMIFVVGVVVAAVVDVGIDVVDVVVAEIHVGLERVVGIVGEPGEADTSQSCCPDVVQIGQIVEVVVDAIETVHGSGFGVVIVAVAVVVCCAIIEIGAIVGRAIES